MRMGTSMVEIPVITHGSITKQIRKHTIKKEECSVEVATSCYVLQAAVRQV